MVGGDLLLARDDNAVIEYIHYLYVVEILRSLSDSKITYKLAWQYGKETKSIWSGCPEMVNEFLQSHPNELASYGVKRINDLVTDLYEYLLKLSTGVYSDVPLDTGELNSVNRCITNLINFIPSSLNKLKSDRSFDSKISGGDYFDIKLVERLLMNVFDSYTDKHRDLDTSEAKKKYGAKRHEVLNTSVYCRCSNLFDLLSKFVNTKLKNIEINLCCSKSINDNRNIISILASIASIFLHLRIPADIHPNRLDRLYDKYVKRNSNAIEAIQLFRQYSGCSALEVITKDCETLKGTQFVKEPMTKNDFYKIETSVRSVSDELGDDNNIERYLVTKFMACD